MVFVLLSQEGLSHIHNEYPYRRYEQQNRGFMTGLMSYRVQTIYVTVVNELSFVCFDNFERLNIFYCCLFVQLWPLTMRLPTPTAT